MVAKTGTNRAAAHLNGGSSKKTKKAEESSSKDDDEDTDDADDGDEDDSDGEKGADEGKKAGKKAGRKKGASSSGKPEPRKQRARFGLFIERRVKIKKDEEARTHLIPIDGAPENFANSGEARRWIKDNGEAFPNGTVIRTVQLRDRVRIEAVTKITVRTD